MTPYVIYARKSTESEDRQVLSIDSQIRELQTLASRRGVSVSEVLTEARSAKAPGRPVFGALMKRVSRGEIGGVICWKMDRLARNHLDTGSILQALADGLIQEVVTSDRTYTRDGNDRFMGSFELGMATKFIDDLSANVRRGNRARFQRGWVNYRPPLGYLNDLATKTIVKDPERFELVRRMWDLFLTGTYRPEKIRQVANEEWGFRTRRSRRMGGNPLCRSLLFRLFTNPFYMGLIRLQKGETFVGAHPPMVSREEFQRAQEILGRAGRPRPQRHEFPFTGLLRCGNCGASVTAEEHVKPSGRRYVYYHCTHNKTGVPCREPAIALHDLEKQIASILQRLRIPGTILEWLLTRVQKGREQEQDRHAAARVMLESTMAQVGREEENLLSLRLRDLVSDETYVARKRAIEERRVDLQAKLKKPSRSREEVARLTSETFQFATCASETFQSGTGVQRRMILEAIGSNYTLRGRRVAFSLKNPLSLIAEASASSNWQACCNDVRTWLQDTTEYFALPDIGHADALGPTKGITPFDPAYGKMVEE